MNTSRVVSEGPTLAKKTDSEHVSEQIDMHVSKDLVRLAGQPSDRHVSIRSLKKQLARQTEGGNASVDPRINAALSPHLSLFNLSQGRRRSLVPARYPGAHGLPF